MKLLQYFIVGVLAQMLSVAAAFAEDIRDVKPPVEFPARWIFLLIGLGVILLLALAYFFYRRYRSRPKKSAPVKTPWEKAYERLDALLKSDWLATGEWGQYYLALSDIVRRYFEERFNIRAPEMTSEEFLASLRDFTGLTDDSRALLQEFLTASDMIKFAKYSPDAARAQKDTALARRLVDETRTLK